MKRVKLLSTIYTYLRREVFLYGQATIEFESMKNTLPALEIVAEHTLEVAGAMPENQYSYKPSEESRPFGQQMVHLAYTADFNIKYTMGIKGKFE